jgi:hypothetical protein
VVIFIFFANEIDENLSALEMELDLDDLERAFLQEDYDNYIKESNLYVCTYVI